MTLPTLDRVVPREIARQCNRDVRRYVSAIVIRLHLVARQRGDALLGAEDAVAQRVVVEERLLGIVVGAPHRLIVVHADLFDDDLLLHFEIVAAQAGAQDVGQDIDGVRQILGENGRVKDRVLLAGEGVGAGADLVEIEVDLEGSAARFKRDYLRYYFTLFGEPSREGKWGLSIEGHHLSLNFVVENDKVAAHTPAFFGANPAVVMSEAGVGPGKGTRVLAKEELLAFELVNSFDAEQIVSGVKGEKAPEDIRAAGEPQPPQAR